MTDYADLVMRLSEWPWADPISLEAAAAIEALKMERFVAGGEIGKLREENARLLGLLSELRNYYTDATDTVKAENARLREALEWIRDEALPYGHFIEAGGWGIRLTQCGEKALAALGEGKE